MLDQKQSTPELKNHQGYNDREANSSVQRRQQSKDNNFRQVKEFVRVSLEFFKVNWKQVFISCMCVNMLYETTRIIG